MAVTGCDWRVRWSSIPTVSVALEEECVTRQAARNEILPTRRSPTKAWRLSEVEPSKFDGGSLKVRASEVPCQEWYDVKAPSMFSVMSLGRTLVTRTQGTKDNDLSEFDESREIIECLVEEYKACESPDYIKWGMEETEDGDASGSVDPKLVM